MLKRVTCYAPLAHRVTELFRSILPDSYVYFEDVQSVAPASLQSNQHTRGICTCQMSVVIN